MKRVLFFIKEILYFNAMKLFALKIESTTVAKEHSVDIIDVNSSNTQAEYTNTQSTANTYNSSKLNKIFSLSIDISIILLILSQVLFFVVNYFSANTKTVDFTIRFIFILAFTLPLAMATIIFLIKNTQIGIKTLTSVVFMINLIFIFLYAINFPVVAVILFYYLVIIIYVVFVKIFSNPDTNLTKTDGSVSDTNRIKQILSGKIIPFYNIDVLLKWLVFFVAYFIFFLPYYQLPIHIVWQGMFFALGFFNNISSVSLLLLLESFKYLNVFIILYFTLFFMVFLIYGLLNGAWAFWLNLYKEKVKIGLSIFVTYVVMALIVLFIYLLLEPFSLNLSSARLNMWDMRNIIKLILPVALLSVACFFMPNKSVIIRHFSTISLLKFLKIILLWYAVSFFVIILCLVAGYILDSFFIDTATDFWQNNLLISTFKHKLQTYTLQDWLHKF